VDIVGVFLDDPEGNRLSVSIRGVGWLHREEGEGAEEFELRAYATHHAGKSLDKLSPDELSAAMKKGARTHAGMRNGTRAGGADGSVIVTTVNHGRAKR
jgi:hypothetical protein